MADTLNAPVTTTYRNGLDFFTKSWRPAGYYKKSGVMMRDLLVPNQQGGFSKRQVVVNNSSLHPMEWAKLDAEVKEAKEPYSRAFEKFSEEGLLDTSFTIATQVHLWSIDNDRDDAQVSISGKKTSFNKVDPIHLGTPLPFIRADYEVSGRDLATSRAAGRDLNVRGARGASKAVAKKRERMIFDGDDTDVAGYKVVGLRGAKGRKKGKPVDFSGDTFTSLSAPYKTVLGVLKALRKARYRGPFGVFVGNAVWAYLQEIHDDGSGNMIMDRILRLQEVKWIEPTDFIPEDEMLFVQLDKDVFELIEAESLSNRQYGSPDAMSSDFMVFTAFSTKISIDHKKKTGIAQVERCLG